MKLKLVILSFHLIFNVLLELRVAECVCKGCVPLDSLTFDKAIRKFSVTLIKFDVPIPYGEIHNAFGSIARDGADDEDLLVAVVGVRDRDDLDTEALVRRYGGSRETLPLIVLIQHDARKNHTKVLTYPDTLEMKSDGLRKWMGKNSRVNLPVDGCLSQFDVLVDEFMEASTVERRDAILGEAISRLSEYGRDEVDAVRKANVYISYMKKVRAEGSVFVVDEIDRVQKVLRQRLPPAKKLLLEQRLNVLKVFDGDSGEKEP